MKKLYLFLLLFISFFATKDLTAQSPVKKVIFQAFWWDYWNSNYPANWSDYITALTPRLKSYGIDALWLPPNSKAGGIGSMGYGSSDPFDLGDKYQKYTGNSFGELSSTRFGTKNGLLRTIAVLHANGMEAIQDVVLNHFDNAGTDVSSAGGIDPELTYSMATNGGYKNFRHVSYATPGINQTQDDYFTRSGRWPVNYPDFYPNAFNPCCSNPINEPYFGPDISYEGNAFGQSSNIPTTGNAPAPVSRPYFNPTQTNNYMLDNARDWLAWYKKQTGVDGMRWDAVKHFPISVQQDLIRNIKYALPLWAQGGNYMTNIGEWIGNGGELDGYITNVSQPSGSYGYEEHTGTFDFSLRGYGSYGGLYSMVHSFGGYNMQNLPGEQQAKRTYNYGATKVHRTIPFVNSHDTYRPILDGTGNFLKPLGDASGWNTSNELGGNGQHIDPREPRLAAAYATIFSMDGNPTVFFEDLFDIGTTGKRFSHLPTSTTDLPVRPDIVNIIQAHQALGFKNGDYGVPTSLTGGQAPFYATGGSGDHIVFERNGKALIGVSDAYSTVSNNSADQTVYVNCQFPNGTVLFDYSGAHGINSVTVPADQRVFIQTAPVGHTISGANGHGYSIWAPLPVGVTAVSSVQDLYDLLANGIQNNNNQTNQEWEMADDLGDSHCLSLGQGGTLPLNSTRQRVAGKIFAAANKMVSYELYPQIAGNNIAVSFWDNNGNILFENNGITSPLTGNFTPTQDQWITIKIRNTVNTQPAQKVYIRTTYTAPKIVDPLAPANTAPVNVSIWTGNKNTTDATDCGNWEEGKLPLASTDVFIPAYSVPFPVFSSNTAVKNITIENGASLQIDNGVTLTVMGDWKNNNSSPLSICGKVAFAGTSLQQLQGQHVFCIVEINNLNNVNVLDNNSVSQNLQLTTGHYLLNATNLTLLPGCTIAGGSAVSYIKIPSTATGGYLINFTGSSIARFPIGNTDYTPLEITNSGTAQNFNVRCFEDVLRYGTSGLPISSKEKLLKTWEITPASTGAVADINFTWNNTNEDLLFNNQDCFVAKNIGGAGQNWTMQGIQSAATGSGPYSKTATGISSFSKFTLFSNTAVLPIKIISFSGKKEDYNVRLNWLVTSDESIEKYIILKSENGIDYTPTGSILHSSLSNYSFTDFRFTKNAWYRLQVVDASGKSTYSEIIFIKTGIGEMQFLLVPNPVTTNCTLVSNGENQNGELGITISNSEGKQLLSKKGPFSVLQSYVSGTVSQFPAGFYFLVITSNGKVQVIKFIKK